MVLDGACQQQVDAELRGLDLLLDLVSASKIWEIQQSSHLPFLASKDGPPGIIVNIFESMKARILGGDPHLKMMMRQKEVCVLRNHSEVLTPSTDSMVSLVLLGEVGWPLQHTPDTLSDKALAQLELPSSCQQRGIMLDELDHRTIAYSMECYQAGQHMNAIAILAEMGRRWYVCRNWEMGEIRPLLATFLNEIERSHVLLYLEAPQCAQDDLFIVL
ncbi:MAG: hypothetical protein QNL20_03620 [Euryarchaeota archaeon]|tara:strand:+ start:801 stop:1451 length:651 start_codon:yes stop_codon:yes gene_type:complete